jgi:uncharacterized protein YbjT (DUF2867 family)
MSKILVTGATGNVGAHVVHELNARGATVRAFVRDPERASARLGDVEMATGDLGDPASIAAAIDGIDRVFVTSADGPDKVAHECAVIDAAAAANVDLVVKLSALHASSRSALPAFGWHGDIEAHLQRSGVPAVVLQPSFFMSNLLMVAAGVADTGTLYAPTGGAKVAMIDARDVAATAAAVLTGDGYAGRTLQLTGPDAITFDDIADAIAAVTARPVAYVDLSAAEARPRFEGAPVPEWLRRQLAGVFDLIRDGEFAQTTDTVCAVTGHAPRGIADFVRDYADAFTG